MGAAAETAALAGGFAGSQPAFQGSAAGSTQRASADGRKDMRTACFRIALMLAFLSAWSLTAQATEDGSSARAEKPAKPARPKRTERVAQSAPGQTAVERPAYGIQNYSPLAA